jgi:hypothetical protein
MMMDPEPFPRNPNVPPADNPTRPMNTSPQPFPRNRHWNTPPDWGWRNAAPAGLAPRIAQPGWTWFVAIALAAGSLVAGSLSATTFAAALRDFNLTRYPILSRTDLAGSPAGQLWLQGAIICLTDLIVLFACWHAARMVRAGILGLAWRCLAAAMALLIIIAVSDVLLISKNVLLGVVPASWWAVMPSNWGAIKDFLYVAAFALMGLGLACFSASSRSALGFIVRWLLALAATAGFGYYLLHHSAAWLFPAWLPDASYAIALPALIAGALVLGATRWPRWPHGMAIQWLLNCACLLALGQFWLEVSRASYRWTPFLFGDLIAGVFLLLPAAVWQARIGRRGHA